MMMFDNFLFVWIILHVFVQNVLSVANERKRVFKFTKVNTIQAFSNRDNVGKPPISTFSTSVLSCATFLMQNGPFTCMEYYDLQKMCRSNNGINSKNSLNNEIDTGWAFYNVESLGNYTGSLRKSTEECKLDDLGMDYGGKKNTTVTGIQCMVWAESYPHAPGSGVRDNLRNVEGPEIVNTNYCRNADATPGGPWCYTMDPNTRWQFCGIPYCQCYT